MIHKYLLHFIDLILVASNRISIQLLLCHTLVRSVLQACSLRMSSTHSTMIEILLKNKEIVQLKSVDEISDLNLDFHVMQFVDYTENDLKRIEEKFGADFSIMKHYEDIEISSHFLATDNQVSFHISIPYYNEEKKLVEAPIFFMW